MTEEHCPGGEFKDRLWIIDPIDGTAHFVNETPCWGIQLCFYDKGATRFAVIYLPVLDELYYSIDGLGAYINNNKIDAKGPAPLNRSIVEFGGTLPPCFEGKKECLRRLVPMSGNRLIANIMHINSSCFAFTNLAIGRTDALIVSTQKPWDIMPGMHICKELGITRTELMRDGKLTLWTSNDKIKRLLID